MAAAAMEMAHRLLPDFQGDRWELSDSPILCESCISDNPDARVLKEHYGIVCEICARPCTVFRWKSGHDARYRRTHICQACCKFKNVCQVWH